MSDRPFEKSDPEFENSTLFKRINSARTLDELYSLLGELRDKTVENSGGFDNRAAYVYTIRLREFYEDLAKDLIPANSIEELDQIAERFILHYDLFEKPSQKYIRFGYVGSYTKAVDASIGKLTDEHGNIEYVEFDPKMPPLAQNPDLEDIHDLHQNAVSIFLEKLNELFTPILVEELRLIGVTNFIEFFTLLDIATFDQLIISLVEKYSMGNTIRIPDIPRDIFGLSREDQENSDQLGNIRYDRLLPDLSSALSEPIIEASGIVALRRFISEKLIIKLEDKMNQDDVVEFVRGLLDDSGKLDPYMIASIIIKEFIKKKIDVSISKKVKYLIYNALLDIACSDSYLVRIFDDITERVVEIRIQYTKNNLVPAVKRSLNGTGRQFMQAFIEDPTTAITRDIQIEGFSLKELVGNQEVVVELFKQVLNGES